jgi:hypothetical protein
LIARHHLSPFCQLTGWQHLAHATGDGYRIIEIWEDKTGFDVFLQDVMFPAAQALRIQREVTVTIETLHNIFVPRIGELAAQADSAPDSPANRGVAST